MTFILFLPFIVILYFLFWRPQQQRVRRQQELIRAIDVGDKVVTAGGLIGRVVEVNDDRMRLEVADGVVIELLRLAVSRRLEESDPGFEETSFSADDEPEEEYGEAEEQSGAGEGDGEEEELVEAEAAAPIEAEPEVAAAPPSPAAGERVASGTIEEAAAPAPKQDQH